MFLRDCTNLQVSRTVSKILRRYFRRGREEEEREVTSRFLESTFLDFQRNCCYPCINYNPSQGSLLYSILSPEHCQYLLVPRNCPPLFIYEYTSRTIKIHGIAVSENLESFHTDNTVSLIQILKLLFHFELLRIRSELHRSEYSYYSIPHDRDHDSFRVFLSSAFREPKLLGEEINVVHAGH